MPSGTPATKDVSMKTASFTYIQNDAGWDIRDPHGELLAAVPDTLHERECVARQIVRGLNLDATAKRARKVRS